MPLNKKKISFSWLSCESCTILDDIDGKCILSNLSKLLRGYALPIVDLNTCVEEVCVSKSRGFPCCNCHYDKWDQWENTYPDMIEKKPIHNFSLFLRDRYCCSFKLYWEEEPDLCFKCWNNKRVWYLRPEIESRCRNALQGRHRDHSSQEASLILKYGIYVIALKTMATMILSLLIFFGC